MDKKKSPLVELHNLRDRIALYGERARVIRVDNRRTSINSEIKHYVRIRCKKEGDFGIFDEDMVIIDPDLVIHASDKHMGRIAMVAQEVNLLLRKYDLSSVEQIIKSCDAIKKTLVRKLEEFELEYVFI